jgi:hypothetical protein
MSDRHFRWYRGAVVTPALLLLALAGCGGGEAGEDAEGDAVASGIPEAGPPLDIQPLGDAELMGIDRAEIVLNMPWSDNVLAKSPAPAAARATLQSVAVSQGTNFDRVAFEFGDDAPAPGYRVVWNDLMAAGCGGEAARELPGEWALIVSIDPATATGGPAAAVRTQAADSTGIEIVERVCDQASRLVWAITAPDSTRVRTIEMRDPPRLLVDVMRPATAP